MTKDFGNEIRKAKKELLCRQFLVGGCVGIVATDLQGLFDAGRGSTAVVTMIALLALAVLVALILGDMTVEELTA